jgi:acyl-homoserine lactone acylase PvdQ
MTGARPVDGTIAATEWKGYQTDETVHVYNPTNGWLQNCNATPYTVAGANSPQKKITCLHGTRSAKLQGYQCSEGFKLKRNIIQLIK